MTLSKAFILILLRLLSTDSDTSWYL